MKKPFIYSAIAFVLFLFGCEEEYDNRVFILSIL